MKENTLRIIVRIALFGIFYLGFALCEWHISITEWHVYSRILFVYSVWIAVTVEFNLPTKNG